MLQQHNNNNDDDNNSNNNTINNNNNDSNTNNSNFIESSYRRRRRYGRIRCATNGWLTMVFVAYAFLLTVRLHFTYSMMVMMTVPLAPGPSDRPPCPGAELNVGANSTIAVAKRLDWTIRQQATTMSAYFFGALVSTLPGGVYSSRGYERSMMLWCVSVTAATVALVPVAFIQYQSWMAVTFLRFLQGCAFGPMGSCGGTLASKIIPKTNRILYSTFMFSGTMFGGFFGHVFSAMVIPNLSHDGSYFSLSIFGLVWAVVWATMIHLTPYVSADDISSASHVHGSFISTVWIAIIRSMPFVSLLNAAFGFGFLYSFITVGLPIYGANVLGGDAVKTGFQVSVSWIIGWITSIFAGTSAASLTNVGTNTKTTIRKLYVGIVLIGSPLMLLGVMFAECNESLSRTFMRMSVILLGFERNSIRINSLDLCPSYVGSLIAMCDIFYSLGNIMDLVVVRCLFAEIMNWSTTFQVTIILSVSCSILFLLFGSSQQQCWDQRYIRP